MASARWISSSWIACIALLPACKGEPTMLDPYLAIADGLAHDQLGALDQRGVELAKAAETQRGEPGIDAIIEASGRIGAQDLEAARTAFKDMSAGVIEYLHAHPEQQGDHTIVHCPMTFDGKGGLWVQKKGKVMNPYEGARMLHCGDKLGWDAELPPT